MCGGTIFFKFWENHTGENVIDLIDTEHKNNGWNPYLIGNHSIDGSDNQVSEANEIECNSN